MILQMACGMLQAANTVEMTARMTMTFRSFSEDAIERRRTSFRVVVVVVVGCGVSLLRSLEVKSLTEKSGFKKSMKYIFKNTFNFQSRKSFFLTPFSHTLLSFPCFTLQMALRGFL